MAKLVINSKYSSIATSDARYFLVTGGRGSGKSFSINTMLSLLMLEDNRTILFLRKTLTSAHLSIIPEFKEKLDILGLSNLFDITKTEITNKINGSAIYFRGIQTSSNDNTANLKSINNVSILVIDEAEELTDEMIFDRIDLSVRQKGVSNKVIIILNPATKEHWIYKRFFEEVGVNGGFNGRKNNVEYIHTTYLDNKENLDDSFLDQIDRVKERSPEKYHHQILGGWLNKAEGVIYDNWEVGDYVDTGYTLFGADFGFSIDPSTLVEISVDKKKKIIYLREHLYKPKLTTSDLYDIMSDVCRNKAIIADSAEPRLIEELRRMGLNIKGAVKGPGSITAGIALMLDYDLIVDHNSINLIKELNNYRWNDKKSSTPMDSFNHILDAARYAASEMLNGSGVMRGSLAKALRSGAGSFR